MKGTRGNRRAFPNCAGTPPSSIAEMPLEVRANVALTQALTPRRTPAELLRGLARLERDPEREVEQLVGPLLGDQHLLEAPA